MKSFKSLGETIIYWEEYHPWMDGMNRAAFTSTPVSGQILELKRGGSGVKATARYFADAIREDVNALPHELLLAHIPSHGVNSTSLGLEHVLDIIRCPGDQVSPLLIERTKTIKKLATGGSRLPEVHEQSMRVDKSARGRRVFILDDVARTGHSLAVACRLVRAAGATQVYPLALTKSV